MAVKWPPRCMRPIRSLRRVRALRVFLSISWNGSNAISQRSMASLHPIPEGGSHHPGVPTLTIKDRGLSIKSYFIHSNIEPSYDPGTSARLPCSRARGQLHGGSQVVAPEPADPDPPGEAD